MLYIKMCSFCLFLSCFSFSVKKNAITLSFYFWYYPTEIKKLVQFKSIPFDQLKKFFFFPAPSMYNISRKAWKFIIAFFLIVTLLFTISSNTSYSKGSLESDASQVKLIQDNSSENAFVTFLCDDVMVI